MQQPMQSWVHNILKPLTATVNMTASISIFNENEQAFVVRDLHLPFDNGLRNVPLGVHDEVWITVVDKHPERSGVIPGHSDEAHEYTPILGPGTYAVVLTLRYDRHVKQHTARFVIGSPGHPQWLS
jgi:hypothetical protein